MSLLKKQESLFKDTIQLNQIVRDHEEDAREIQKVDRILVIGLALIILIIPLLVRAHIIDFVSPIITGTSFDTGMKVDVFTYFKYFSLMIGTIILGIIFLYKVFALGYKIPKCWLNALIGALTLIIVLSAVFSPFKKLALEGMYNRHDGTISYLCYIALFFIAANIKYSSKTLKIIIYSLIPFTIINGGLGLLNLYGYDVLQWGWVNSLLFGGLPEGAEIKEGANLWSTLSNPNYISGFAGVLTALFFSLTVVRGNLIEKIVCLILSFVSFATVLASLSTSGFLAFIITVPFIFAAAFFTKSKIKSLSFWVVGLVGFVLVLNTLASHNPRVWTESVGFLIEKNPFIEAHASMKSLFDFKLETEASAADEEFNLKELPAQGAAAGSGRVYIWGKTLEMIKETPILGYGLDTFIYQFPQDDPEKQAGLRSHTIIVDKPHNVFIGLAYGSGVFAVLCLLGITAFILFKWVTNIFNTKNNQEAWGLRLGLGMCLVAFYIQAMFNDSIMGFTNTMFILLGVLASEVVYKKNQSIGDN